MKGPTFVSHSADEFTTVIDGSYFAGKKADFNLALGRPSTSAPYGFPTWPANTPTAASSP